MTSGKRQIGVDQRVQAWEAEVLSGCCNKASNLESDFEPGSNDRVLANKLGIFNAGEMDDTELRLLDCLYEDVLCSVEAGQRLTVADICEWHRRWLGNVYPWAGMYRTVNLSKGNFMFAAGGQVPRLMGNLDQEILAVHTPCAGMREDQLIDSIAIVHVEFILIHPFREGNGRLSRLLANVMAQQAGWLELDFTFWDDRKDDYVAAVQSGLSDYDSMKTMVRQVLRETVRTADE